jgi:hypothetical protein
MQDHISGNVTNKQSGAQAIKPAVSPKYQMKRQSSLTSLNGYSYMSSYVYGRNFPDNTLISLVLRDEKSQGNTYNHVPFDTKTISSQPRSKPIKYFPNVLPDSSSWPYFSLDSGYIYTLSATVTSILSAPDPYSFRWFNVTDFSFIGNTVSLLVGETNQKCVAQINPKKTTQVALLVVYNGKYDPNLIVSNFTIKSARCTVNIVG